VSAHEHTNHPGLPSAWSALASERVLDNDPEWLSERQLCEALKMTNSEAQSWLRTLGDRVDRKQVYRQTPHGVRRIWVYKPKG
jgi:hypothetical protein